MINENENDEVQNNDDDDAMAGKMLVKNMLVQVMTLKRMIVMRILRKRTIMAKINRIRMKILILLMTLGKMCAKNLLVKQKIPLRGASFVLLNCLQ